MLEFAFYSVSWQVPLPMCLCFFIYKMRIFPAWYPWRGMQILVALQIHCPIFLSEKPLIFRWPYATPMRTTFPSFPYSTVRPGD